MFCGSCMHDNTWARALIRAGAEVLLVPTYTPIRVDERDASTSRVFFGGLNVYLNSRWKWWRYVPRFAKSVLDRPALIKLATRFSVSNDANQLGELTLSMLAGQNGPHQAAAEELAEFLAKEFRPDVVIFSNALLSGAVATLKQRLNVPILCVLQGDDVFLDGLPDKYRQQAIDRVGELSRQFDGLITHSRFYRRYMAEYLKLPKEQFHLVPLGIDMEGHDGQPGERQAGTFTIGYFARIAPEKGLHHLVDAFAIVRDALPDARLKIGGYLGPQHAKYFEHLKWVLDRIGYGWEYVGSPATHEEKVSFYRSIDVLSVPTAFQEPKGLYVLEAMANGVPVVQPEHGAFPEMLHATAGGLLVKPQDARALADGLLALADPTRRLPLAHHAHQAVREHYSSDRMSAQTLELLHTITKSPRISSHEATEMASGTES